MRSPKYKTPYLLCGYLLNQINPKHQLVILSKKISWEQFDKLLASKYGKRGHLAKFTRLMAGVLILKLMYNLRDVRV